MVRALFAVFVFCCYGNSALANPARCEKLFKELAAIATCITISSMSGGALSDEELRDTVSRQINSLSPEKFEKEAAKREEERRKAEAEREAALIKTDQCYRLFVESSERESCRILRMVSISERTDDEMREAVRERLERERKEDEQRKASLEAEKRRNAGAAEADRKRKAETEAKLKRGPIGFALNRWELGGFGTVMIIRFTLQNNTGTPQKDFVIGCNTHGNSGTQLSALQRTLYERLEPGARRFFELNLGAVNSQSARASCGVFGSVAG